MQHRARSPGLAEVTLSSVEEAGPETEVAGASPFHDCSVCGGDWRVFLTRGNPQLKPSSRNITLACGV